MSAAASGPGLRLIRVWVAVEHGDFSSYLRSVLDGQREFGFVRTTDPLEADVAIAELGTALFDSVAWLEGLRRSGPRAALPVLFLGGSEAAWSRLAGDGDPAIGRLALPFNANSLRAAIRKLVELRRAAD